MPPNHDHIENRPYNEAMPRKPTHQRPAQGEHLFKLRVAAGLTQVELAKMVGETHSNIAFWEKADKPPRSDVLPRLAEALGVSVEEILRPHMGMPRHRGGPVGKLRRAFEIASALPRSQQEKIVEIVTALAAQFKKAS